MTCSYSALEAAQPQAAHRAFAEAAAAFEQGRYEPALSGFVAARAAGMDDAAVNYNIAVCYYKLGRYAQAAAAFRQVAARFQSLRDLADYNLGLSLLRQGRDKEARAVFERVRAAKDPKLVRLAEAALARTAPPAPAAIARTALVNINAGRDDNVALVETPILLPGESASSPLTEMFAFVAAPLPLGPRFDYDASAYAIRYTDAREFDQNALSAAATYRRGFGAWRAALGPRLSYSTLGGSGFEKQIGAAITLRHPLSVRSSLILRYTHDRITAASSQYDFVAGRRDRLRIGIERAWTEGRLSAYYEREVNDRSAATVSPGRNTFSVTYRRRLTGAWAMELNLRDRSSRYQDLVPRKHEELREIGVGIGRELRSGWRFNAEVLHADNASNDPLYAYRRNRIDAGIGKSF